jgi:hypothetical protein
MNDRDVMALIDQGTELGDQKRLRSALDVLGRALASAPNPRLRALAAYQLGALHWGEVGNGVEAHRLFEKTVAEAGQCDGTSRDEMVRTLEANACENLMLLSLSYEEYDRWAERLRGLQSDNPILVGHVAMIRQHQVKCDPWSDVLMQAPHVYYRRHDPAHDPRQYGAARSIFHVLLANRAALRLNRNDWGVAVSEYAKLSMKICTEAIRTLGRHIGIDAVDTSEVLFVQEEALPLVEEYVAANPGDSEPRGDRDRLRKSLELLRPAARPSPPPRGGGLPPAPVAR